MNIPNNFMFEVRNASNMLYNDAKEKHSLVSLDELFSIKIESIAMAAIDGYHTLLRNELLKEGIDIGSFGNED